MDSNEHFKSTLGFIDLLFNILVGFAFLFIIAFLLIKPEAKKKDFDRRAEYIVVMEWDAGAKDDIDLYVEDPLGGIANFRHPRVNFMHLDKDDLGSRNDTTVMADGSTTTIKINREVMTIRGIIPGEWIINAHYYSSYAYGTPNPPDYFITVRVELHRVNPYQILWVGEKKFIRKGQEETFLRWRIDKMGGIIPPYTFQKKNYVKPAGQVSSDEGPARGGTTGSSHLSYFSSMGVQFEQDDRHPDESDESPRYDIGGSAQPIAGPMEGMEIDEEQWIRQSQEASGGGP